MLLQLFVLALASTASAKEACTAEEQEGALVNAFTAWGGNEWHNKKGWLDSTLECRLKDLKFPAHCCWHGITCCVSSTCAETERPDVDRCGCKQGLVWGINLDSNNLVGNFTRFDHTPFACSLQRLKLSYNGLSGEISGGIKVHKRLSSLELQANELQGTLPTEIGQVSSLRLVLLSSNKLEGTVPPDICSNASRLSSLAIDDNNFSGLLDLTHCKKLTYVAAKGNNLAPNLDEALPELKSVFLEDNSLVGALPDDIFANFLPNLEQLAISKNKLSGRLPDMSMYSLKNVILDENRFVGPIPDSWSRIARPNSLVRLDTNYLSCCGIKPMTIQQLSTVNRTLRIDEVYEGVDYSAPLLPPFLELSDELEPVTVKLQQSFKAAGMRCPTLRIVGQEANPEGTLDWFLDPSYYMFEKCECDEGLRLVNLTKPGHIFYFECQVPELDSSSSSDQTWVEAYPWTVVIIVVVGCLLLVMTSFALYLYKGKEVLRKLRNLKKRTQGLPSSGPFVAVVTDIQGWTDLCAMHPDLSMKVLGIHNSILRKARWMNFGYTHETEGDSFTVVFCDAKDAAAFCLQAQQMLNMQQWPCPRQSSNSEEGPFPHMKNYVNPLSKLPMVPMIKDFSMHGVPKIQTFGSSRNHSNLGGPASLDVRVRMGMASGFLHQDESLHGHPTIAKAKEVSDAAVGGQILMEGNTFAAIKDSLGELGTVDAQVGMGGFSLN
ncbi:hypothetical protein DUNSADRAFT_17323 [Dunaliella salina]|uniref:Guanylate cyclase domain-containing protein n=1 Tax=Dunaliella salina TaxID=3046 RepID=A0ABQ7G1Z0_DUNSA|nr:hypothetical protein DUNSADRAFT_17323 [Dunaliella salina]|eukprot:KAF5828610.1 hypothetical protein DUNSADRAFT_17323 [Dunaliella salina]